MPWLRLFALAAVLQLASAGFSDIHALVQPYPLELHAIQTLDGYQLSLYRIPGSPPGSGAPHPPPRNTLRAGGAPASPAAAAQGGARTLAARSPSPAAAGAAPGARKPAVLLQHGLLDSCAAWLVSGQDTALAFLLADAGFDVWLANARGCTQSRRHAFLPVTSDAYWAFSFDEMAQFDLPAQLDRIQAVTGATTVSFVGHSQGTTILLAALASQPQLWRRLGLAVLLAPVALARHVSSVPLKTLAALDTDAVFTLLGAHEFLPSVRLISWLEGQLCESVRPDLCISILAAICGYRRGALNTTRLPTMLQYTPAGTSVQSMAHWAQAVRGGATPGRPQFSKFDYGTACPGLSHGPTDETTPRGGGSTHGTRSAVQDGRQHDGAHARNASSTSSQRRLRGSQPPAASSWGPGQAGQPHLDTTTLPVTPPGAPCSRQGTCNQWKYNARVPPPYPLQDIHPGMRLALFTGGQDRLADPLDVELLLEALPAGVVVAHQHDADLEHLDYTWAMDARTRVYGRVLQLLQEDARAEAARAG